MVTEETYKVSDYGVRLWAWCPFVWPRIVREKDVDGYGEEQGQKGKANCNDVQHYH